MSWTITFDGITFDNTTGTSIPKVKDKPIVKIKESPLLGDGIAIERYSRAGRRIKMSGTVIGTSTTQLDTRVSDIIEAFSNPSGGYLSLSSGRRIFAYPKIDTLELIKGSGNLALDFAVEFYTESPYWESTTVTTVAITLATAGTNTLLQTVTVAGTAPTRPLIKISQKTGTVGVRDPLGLSISNLTLDSPEYIRITGAALGNDTDVIVLDAEDESVYLDNDTSSSSKVPKRIDGTFPRLQSGANAIYLDAQTTGGDLTVSLLYRDRYYSSGF